MLGDITTPIYKDVTVASICNIMFGEAINARVTTNLLKCPRLRTVASIVQLHHPRLKLVRTALIGCTWAVAGVSWHLYRVLEPPSTSRQSAHWLSAPRAPPPRWTRPTLREAAAAGVCHSVGSAARFTGRRPFTVAGEVSGGGSLHPPLATLGALGEPLAGKVDHDATQEAPSPHAEPPEERRLRIMSCVERLSKCEPTKRRPRTTRGTTRGTTAALGSRRAERDRAPTIGPLHSLTASTR